MPFEQCIQSTQIAVLTTDGECDVVSVILNTSYLKIRCKQRQIGVMVSIRHAGKCDVANGLKVE